MWLCETCLPRMLLTCLLPYVHRATHISTRRTKAHMRRMRETNEYMCSLFLRLICLFVINWIPLDTHLVSGRVTVYVVQQCVLHLMVKFASFVTRQKVRSRCSNGMTNDAIVVHTHFANYTNSCCFCHFRRQVLFGKCRRTQSSTSNMIDDCYFAENSFLIFTNQDMIQILDIWNYTCIAGC